MLKFPDTAYLTTETPGVTAMNGPARWIAGEKSLSIDERVEKWYLAPLRKMVRDDCFVCLMVCMPILEKCIRKKTEMGDTGTFSNNSVGIRYFAKLLSIPVTDAELLWDSLRNGILHRATPAARNFNIALIGTMKKMCEIHDNDLWLNPWKLRDCVVKLAKDKVVWRDEDYPLMREWVEE